MRGRRRRLNRKAAKSASRRPTDGFLKAVYRNNKRQGEKYNPASDTITGEDTRSIEPKFTRISVTRHAIDRYAERTGQIVVDDLAERRIKIAVLYGRRSDRDTSLKDELESWIGDVNWTHAGRPVCLFFQEKHRLGVLVVADKDRPNALVVLTCFEARFRSEFPELRCAAIRGRKKSRKISKIPQDTIEHTAYNRGSDL